MSEIPDWLPDLVYFVGDWHAYEDLLYSLFKADFIDSVPYFPEKRVGLKRHPLFKLKEATFWHFITEGPVEEKRTPDLRRCERIRWPRPLIESFKSNRILYWRNNRGTNKNILLALPDFSYVVVLRDRGDYVMPWTAFCTDYNYRRSKLQKEYEAYWATQKG